MKSNKHKARIESGTGRDGANGFAFGGFSASSYERYENDKERKFQLSDDIYNQRGVWYRTCLMVYTRLKRQVHCISLATAVSQTARQ